MYTQSYNRVYMVDGSVIQQCGPRKLLKSPRKKSAVKIQI